MAYAEKDLYGRIGEDLQISHKSLSSVRALEGYFLPMESALCAVKKIVEGLKSVQLIFRRHDRLTDDMRLVLEHSSTNLLNDVASFRRNTSLLIQKTRNTGDAISQFMNFRNQAMAQEQNKFMSKMTTVTMEDSLNVRVITLVTLFYLPVSFLAVS